MNDRPGYVLLTEAALTSGDQETIGRYIDEMLGELNYEYSDKRHSGRILPLTVRQVPQGTWLALRRNKSAARGNFEEYKHRCLIGDLDFIERIPSLSQTQPNPNIA
jgi:hypothetical protein